MSAQTIYEAFLPVEMEYREQIRRDTWGHLAPREHRVYRGEVVFAVGCFGNDPINPTVLNCRFRGLDESPWFFESLIRFIGKRKRRPGGVYRWEGEFCNYKFKGSFTRLRLGEVR